ncbi:4-coumarate-CoA ligase-like protein 2 [Phlyctema vagabunda]|uniref:4-coumarate-CoA ligase-like protein 2 n=1 Tax=Phlyctema vagabunda TaxID=108571 RepID=A0ABR4PMH0_9HELO
MDIVSWTFAKSKKYDQDKPLYIDPSNPERSLSANQVRTTVRQLACGLESHGLVKGDTVCVLSFNDIYYTSLYLGIIGAGGCFTGANPGYTAYELAHHLRTTQAKYLISAPKTLNVATEAAKECGLSNGDIYVLNLHGEVIPEGYQSWSKLLSCGEKDWVKGIDAANTTAAYVSTSGTSGLPKAAILTHSYMVSQAEVIGRVTATPGETSHMIAIPPFHVFTIPAQHALPIRRGTTCYIMPRYEQETFMQAIKKFQISKTVVVPPILMSLSKSKHTGLLRSLRSIHVGGSCATDGMQQQLYDKLHPDARILQVYGMTEAGWATTWQEKATDCSGSVGKPLPGTRFRLVDSDDQVIKKDGVHGEIHIRAPHPMKGYLNNATATAEAFTPDGWVRSGDVGFVRKGKWYVIDRTKDLIKVRGWQVSPAEIEAVILEHPDVADAAVIGVAARDTSGEVPHGYVVRKPGSQVNENDIKSFLATRLARYKSVDAVKFIDHIPRNPTGKILRRVLRDSKGTQIVPADQSAAMAYSNAIKTLERLQQSRNAERRAAMSKPPARSHSRSASLTDASTIDLSEPPSPSPGLVSDETGLPVVEDFQSLKRKAEELSPVRIKRQHHHQ